MKYAEMKPGRIFNLRLDEGKPIHEGLQKFALEKGIKRAFVMCIGGAGEGSTVVSGVKISEDGTRSPIYRSFNDIHEMQGVGVINTDRDGNPVAHLHMSFGRDSETITGCIRNGVNVCILGEVVIIELSGDGTMKELESI